MVSPHSKGSTHDSSCIPLIPVPQRPVEGPAHSRCILNVHGTGESSSQCQPPPSLIHSLLLIIRPDVPLAVGALGWGFANPSFRASAKHPHVFSPMLRSPHALGFPNAPGIPPRSVLCSRIILSVCAEDGSEEDKIENKNELEGCYANLSKKMMGARKNTMAVRIEISEQI